MRLADILFGRGFSPSGVQNQGIMQSTRFMGGLVDWENRQPSVSNFWNRIDDEFFPNLFGPQKPQMTLEEIMKLRRTSQSTGNVSQYSQSRERGRPMQSFGLQRIDPKMFTGKF